MLDYSLADFLLFSPSTYWRLFERLNTAVWPLQPLILCLITLVAVVAVRAGRWAGLTIGLCLAICWTLVAHLFFAIYYAPINWVIEWVTPLAWVQAGLLISLAAGLQFQAPERTQWSQISLVGLVLAYPLFGILEGRPIEQSEVAGLAPDPTAVASLALVWLARPSWRKVALSILPLMWIAFSAATLFAMDMATAWVLFAVLAFAALSVLGSLSQRFRRVSSG